MRKLTIIAVLMLLCMSALFAVSGYVTWTWFENDPDVEYFRYQVDGENEDGWTIVDWSVNEVTILLDLSEPHSLYLQQSYDGENWSESSVVESEVFTEESLAPADDTGWEEELYEEGEPQQEAEQNADETETSTTEETAVAEETAHEPEVPKYLPVKAFDYGFGYLNAIPDNAGPRALGLSLAYTRTFGKVKVFDIGIKANASMYYSYDGFADASDALLISYVNTLALVTTEVGNCDIYFGFGPDVGFDLLKGNNYKVGVSLEFGVRYHRTHNIAFGFALADHQYFYPVDGLLNRFDARVFMSSSF